MMNIAAYGSLPELIIQIAVVVLLASLIAFALARRFYRSEAASRLEILQQEIMRLRRRVADAERDTESARRSTDRVRRQAKRIPELDGLGI